MSPAVIGFGDESEDQDSLVYALAIFRPARTDDARRALAGMKRSLGVPEGARLHCRVVFSGQRRRGTPWANVNHSRIEDAVRTLVSEVRTLGEAPEIGVLDRRRVPLLPTAPGHPDREWRSKETLALAANLAIMGAVTRYGVDRVRIVIDRDSTRIERGLQRRRADTTRGLFVDVGPGSEPVKIEPVVEDDALLEVADVYAYTGFRTQRSEPGRLFRDLVEIIQPNIRTMDLSGRGPWTDASKGGAAMSS